MRTTIDLPEDLHEQARAIARDTRKSVSAVIADLARKGLRSDTADETDLQRDPRTGLPTLSSGRVITTEMVRESEDDE